MTDSPFVVLDRGDVGRNVKALPLSGITSDMLFGGTQPDTLSPAAIYQTVAWVYRCIQYRADAIAGIPWTLEGRPKGVDVAMLEHRLPDLLRRTEASLCLDAGAYIFKERNKAKLLNLRWMAYRTIQAEYDAAGVTGFKRQVGSTQLSLTPDEVVYVWLPDPLTEIGPGVAPAAVALKSAGIVASANEFTTQFFTRGGMNATLLIVDPTTSDADLKRLEAWWKRLMAGIRQAWQTVAMRRNVDVKQLGYEPEKLAMPALKAEARSEIVAAFGLSEDIVASNAANFATATTHALTTLQHTILPEAKIIAAALNEQLLNPLGLELVWHPEQMEVLQQANTLQSDAIVKLFAAGIISREEARVQSGFPATEAVDEIVGGSEGNETSVTPTGTPDTTGAIPPPMRTVKRAPDGADAARRKIENAHAPPIARALGQQMDMALNGSMTDPKAVAGRVTDDDATLRKALTAMLTEAARLGVDDGANALGDAALGIDWNLVNRDALKWAEQYAYELVGGVNDTTRQVLREKVAAWIESGAPLDALKESLAPWFGEERATLIASTEVTRAFASGNKEAWAASDVVTGWTWQTANDELVCDICGPLDGKDHEMNDDMPPAHPRCRCWAAPRVD